MNIQEYISSGIVESYVLGLADQEERAEFERMCAAHHEVREAREAFEISLEQYARKHAIQPSKKIKSKIFAEIDIETDQSYHHPDFMQPVVDETDRTSIPSVTCWIRYLAVASVILLVISVALNVYYFNKYLTYKNQLLASLQQFASNKQILQTKLQEYQKAFEWMKNPNMAIVKMPGVPSSPDPNSATTVYWDTQTKDVYLMVNKLPVPNPDQQYQLWALVDGKPVDAGVFDVKEGILVVKMKNIPKAEAFAVTLEKRGGNPTPTMDKMYVMGKV